MSPPASRNGRDPLTLAEFMELSGPHRLSDMPDNAELFEHLATFSRNLDRLPLNVERERARGFWNQELTSRGVDQPWRLLEAACADAKLEAGGSATPVVKSLAELFAETDPDEEEADWLLPGYIARETLGGITGKPKSGKTTLLMHMAAAIASGRACLGLRTQQVPVLWLNLEMSERLARVKLRKVLGEAAPGFYIATGTRAVLTPAAVERCVTEYGIGFVVVDSLSKFWRVQEENSSSETDAAIDLALQLTRRTGSGIELIHHSPKHRNAGDTVMDMFRGSGAIGANLDVGILLTKPGKSNVRRIEAESRFDATPRDQWIALTEAGYRVTESPAAVKAEMRTDAVRSALTGEYKPLDAIMGRLASSGHDLSDRTVRRYLQEMERTQQVDVRNESRPFTYRLAGTPSE